ncbi:MAG: hypothetical protein MMC23_003165 [Stictis urceolatum]|nr:hypothetical protein [Stictis urceolata]
MAQIWLLALLLCPVAVNAQAVLIPETLSDGSVTTVTGQQININSHGEVQIQTPLIPYSWPTGMPIDSVKGAGFNLSQRFEYIRQKDWGLANYCFSSMMTQTAKEMNVLTATITPFPAPSTLSPVRATDTNGMVVDTQCCGQCTASLGHAVSLIVWPPESTPHAKREVAGASTGTIPGTGYTPSTPSSAPSSGATSSSPNMSLNITSISNTGPITTPPPSLVVSTTMFGSAPTGAPSGVLSGMQGGTSGNGSSDNSIVVSNGFTFTSPTVYIAVSTVWGQDLCGGKVDGGIDHVTYHPITMSTLQSQVFVSYTDRAVVPVASPYNIEQQASECSDWSRTGNPHTYKTESFPDTSVTYDAYVQYSNPCSPQLSFPTELLDLHPAIKSCVGVALLDPPQTLTKWNGPGLAKTRVNPGPKPVPSPVPVQTSSPAAAEAMTTAAPMRPAQPESKEPTVHPLITSESQQAPDPKPALSSAPALVDPSPSPEATLPGPHAPGTSTAPQPVPESSPPPANNPSPGENTLNAPQPQDGTAAIPQPTVIEINSQKLTLAPAPSPAPSNPNPVDIPSGPGQPQSEPQPQPQPQPEPAIIVASHTLNAGDTAVTLSNGDALSLGTDRLVVGSKTEVFVPPAATPPAAASPNVASPAVPGNVVATAQLQPLPADASPQLGAPSQPQRQPQIVSAGGLQLTVLPAGPPVKSIVPGAPLPPGGALPLAATPSIVLGAPAPPESPAANPALLSSPPPPATPHVPGTVGPTDMSDPAAPLPQDSSPGVPANPQASAAVNPINGQPIPASPNQPLSPTSQNAAGPSPTPSSPQLPGTLPPSDPSNPSTPLDPASPPASPLSPQSPPYAPAPAPVPAIAVSGHTLTPGGAPLTAGSQIISWASTSGTEGVLVVGTETTTLDIGPAPTQAPGVDTAGMGPAAYEGSADLRSGSVGSRTWGMGGSVTATGTGGTGAVETGGIAGMILSRLSGVGGSVVSEPATAGAEGEGSLREAKETDAASTSSGAARYSTGGFSSVMTGSSGTAGGSGSSASASASVSSSGAGSEGSPAAATSAVTAAGSRSFAGLERLTVALVGCVLTVYGV